MSKTELAQALIDAADEGGVIQAPSTVPLTSDPTLHTTMMLRQAARRLGVERETARLLDTDWPCESCGSYAAETDGLCRGCAAAVEGGATRATAYAG